MQLYPVPRVAAAPPKRRNYTHRMAVAAQDQKPSTLKAYERTSNRLVAPRLLPFFQVSLLPRSAHLTRDCAGVDATRDENAQGAVESF